MQLKFWLALSCCIVAAPSRADMPMARDGTGALLGSYTAILEHAGIVIVSPLGYRMVVMRETGWIRGAIDDTTEHVYFENFNCTGQAYLDRGAQFRGVMVPVRGGISFALQALYYIPQTAIAESKSLNGRQDAGANGGLSCTQIAPRTSISVPAFPNDPGTTGVPSADFVAPITVTRNELFRDGFEASLATGESGNDRTC